MVSNWLVAELNEHDIVSEVADNQGNDKSYDCIHTVEEVSGYDYKKFERHKAGRLNLEAPLAIYLI